MNIFMFILFITASIILTGFSLNGDLTKLAKDK